MVRSALGLLAKILVTICIYLFLSEVGGVAMARGDDDDDEGAESSSDDDAVDQIAVGTGLKLSGNIYDALTRNQISFLKTPDDVAAALNDTAGPLVVIEGYWSAYQNETKVSARLMELVKAAGDGATFVVHTSQGEGNIDDLLAGAIKTVGVRNTSTIALINKQEFQETANGSQSPARWHGKRRVHVQTAQDAPVYLSLDGDDSEYLTSRLLHEQMTAGPRRIIIGVMEGPNSSVNRILRLFAKADLLGLRGDVVNIPEIKLFVGADAVGNSPREIGYAATQLAAVRELLLRECGPIAHFDVLDAQTGKPMTPAALRARLRGFASLHFANVLPLPGMESGSYESLDPSTLRVEHMQRAGKRKLVITFTHPPGHEGAITEFYLGSKPLTEVLGIEKIEDRKINGSQSIFEFDLHRGLEKGELAVEYTDRWGHSHRVSLANPFHQSQLNHLSELSTASWYYEHLLTVVEEAFAQSFAVELFTGLPTAMQELVRVPTHRLQTLFERKSARLDTGDPELSDAQYRAFKGFAQQHRLITDLLAQAKARQGQRLEFNNKCSGGVF